ncbi:MAG: histidine phosphatase family protein [Candidatus Polarisedimenticolia bacterium]
MNPKAALMGRSALVACLSALAVCDVGWAAEASSPKLVLLVRHAEKAAQPAGDPSLTEAGAARAQSLAAALRDAGVSAVITTQLRRTQETAGPLASLRGLSPEVVPVESGKVEEHVRAVAAAVGRHAGEVVLVVGHSNTIPAIIAALGGPRWPDLCDSMHASLFVLIPDPAGSRVVRSLYGAPDPAPGPDCPQGAPAP